MLIRYLILTLFIFISLPAHAENLAQSYIGLCSKHWPCSRTVKALEKERVLRFGFLFEGFHADRGCPCAKRLLEEKRVKVFRVHLVNGTCFPERGRRCQKFETFYGLRTRRAERSIVVERSRLLKKLTLAARDFTKFYHSVDKESGRSYCFVSPIIEIHFTPATRRRIILAVKKHLPVECTIVDNPLVGPCLPGYLCERHGSLAKSDIVDLDGHDMRDVNVRRYLNNNKHALMAFVWTKRFNLLSGNEKGFIEPAKRTAQPSLNDLRRGLQYGR